MAVRVISYALRVTDIMEEGVTLVEKMEIDRQPMPTAEAMYVMAPTVRRLCTVDRGSDVVSLFSLLPLSPHFSFRLPFHLSCMRAAHTWLLYLR